MLTNVDRVTLARVAKSLLGPRSPTHRTDRARSKSGRESRWVRLQICLLNNVVI